MEEAGTVQSPCEEIKIRRLICGFLASLERRPATQSGVDTPLVVVGGKSIQLAMKVEAVPTPLDATFY